MRCPCGEGEFATCCEPIIDGTPAPTAEALMRSRYSAYATRHEFHLARSWHPRTRPDGPLCSTGTTWTGLEILDVVGGDEDDSDGIVEFVAHYVSDGQAGQMRERSTFTRRASRWVYVDGVIS